MKVTELWKNRKRPSISMELFPARDEKAAASLDKAIDELAELKPDFVSVTFGAGGSTREGSRGLVKKLKDEKGLEVTAYFAGYGLGPVDITGVLDSYRDLGIDNILVVRGDPPHDQQDFTPHPESLPHASDLLSFIRQRYDFCLGAACYPEGHIEAESREKDLEYLALKVKNGARFLIANYFYDNGFFFDFISRCRSAGIDVPVLPGIMPIFSVKMMERLAGICGATITGDIRAAIAALPEGDKYALLHFGIDYAVKQCNELLQEGVPGLHFYTMDRSQSTAGVIRRLRSEGILGER